MATATARLSAEEFAEQYIDVPLVELVRGVVVHLSPGMQDHGGCSASIAGLLFVWSRQSGLGRIFSNEFGVITSRDPDTVRGVDVVYLSYARLPKGQRYEGFCTIPPDLAVEVVGKGQGWKTMTEKAAEYLRMGVSRVWIVDPRRRNLHVFTADAPPQVLDETSSVTDELILPGFSCRVAEFFED